MVCLICANPCAADARICDSAECIFASMHEYLNDDFISEFIKENESAFKLIMLLAYKKAQSDEPVFSTNPNIGLTAEELNAKILLLCKHNIVKATHDIDIINANGLESYKLIKFIIKNALMEFKICLKDLIIPDVNIFEFSYSDVVNQKFDAESKRFGMTYRFHGSPLHNWYSIISDGLKVFSYTSKMKHGASYGKGIYLASHIGISIGYCGGGTQQIVGVFENINNTKVYDNGGVVVAKYASDIRLKYLIKSNKQLTPESTQQLSQYFNKDKTQLVSTTNSYIGNIRNKRLLMEIRNIMMRQSQESANIGDFKLCDIEHTNIWNILIINIDKDTKLYADMVNYNIDNIHVEIRFENNYPLSPPFVRIIKPAFKRLTGHVTQGGSICAEILTNQGWSPAINMESLLVTLKAVISEDGRLDLDNASQYNLDSAKNSYINMLRVHGWQ